MGPTVELDYVVEDRKLKLSGGGSGAVIFTIDDKGCIDGGLMTPLGVLCKK